MSGIDLRSHERNDRLVDIWSLVHFASGVALGWALPVWLAVVILVAWEPIEVLVLSRIMATRGVLFGHESWRNVLSDIVVDVAGVLVGHWVATSVTAPPW